MLAELGCAGKNKATVNVLPYCICKPGLDLSGVHFHSFQYTPCQHLCVLNSSY